MATIKLPGVMRHPKTGMLWLRRVVPPHLREHLGQREFRLSIGTKDIAEAKRRYPALAAQVQSKIDQAEAEYYDRAEDEAVAAQEAEEDYEPPDIDELREGFLNAMTREELRDALLSTFSPGQKDLYERMRKAQPRRASSPSPVVTRPAERPGRPDVERQVTGTGPDKPTSSPSVVTLRQALEFWARDARPAPTTVYKWGLGLDRFTAWLGHEDATRVTRADVIRFKDHLLSEGKAPKTCRITIGTLKTVYANCIANDRLRGPNPCDGIKIVAKGRQTDRRRGYTEAEAIAALEAVEGHQDPAIRLLPLLMCWTGLRLEEACGLRLRDVRQVNGAGWCVEVAAYKGHHVKADSMRVVPLHAALEPFIAFAQERQAQTDDQDDLIWTTLSRDKHGKLSSNATHRLSRVIRKAVADPNVAPSHGFRHLMATRLRSVAQAPEQVAKAILGHSDGSTHGRYGDRLTSAVLRTWIDRLEPLEA
jgi:integrase